MRDRRQAPLAGNPVLRVKVFYDFSGGMESAAMLAVDMERILDTRAIVRWANTGKQFPEMAASIAQIESILDLKIVEVPRRITFDETGGMCTEQ